MLILGATPMAPPRATVIPPPSAATVVAPGTHSLSVIEHTFDPISLSNQAKLVPHDALPVWIVVHIDVTSILPHHARAVHPFHAIDIHALITNIFLEILLAVLSLPGGKTRHYPLSSDIGHLVAGALCMISLSLDPIAIVEDAVVIPHLALVMRTRLVVHLSLVYPSVAMIIG